MIRRSERYLDGFFRFFASADGQGRFRYIEGLHVVRFAFVFESEEVGMHRRFLCVGFVIGCSFGLAVLGSAGGLGAGPPEPVLLWPDGAPGAVGEEDADRPSIRIYRPENPNGAAIVICPGGGYRVLAMDHEGHQIARWLNTIGVTGVVLKYRLAPRYRHPAPLTDVQRAIRYVRAHADELSLDADRTGVMGFSAGGHLASTVSTHFDDGAADADNPVERASCRPDFTILGYPVISLRKPFTHGGSVNNLLGENPDPQLVDSLSNETQVTARTPRAFLFHTGEDAAVPVENCLAYYRALVEHDIPAELHVYQNGVHGVGLGIADPVLFTWKDRLADWLQTNGILADVARVEVSGTVTLNGEPVKWGTITFEPQDVPQAPVAGDRIADGKYRIPALRGVAVGVNRVTVRTLGSIAPVPTLDDVVTLTGEGTVAGVVNFQAELDGINRLDLELVTEVLAPPPLTPRRDPDGLNPRIPR
jgi:acetyl esterase/lipase